MRKHFCDICGKDITGERYRVIVSLDDFVVREKDVCVDFAEKIREMLEAPQK